MLNKNDLNLIKVKLNKEVEKLFKQINKLETDIAKNDEILNTKRNKIEELRTNYTELSQLLQNL